MQKLKVGSKVIIRNTFYVDKVAYITGETKTLWKIDGISYKKRSCDIELYTVDAEEDIIKKEILSIIKRLDFSSVPYKLLSEAYMILVSNLIKGGKK